MSAGHDDGCVCVCARARTLQPSATPFCLTKSKLRAHPGNRLLTGEGLAVDSSGNIQVNGVDFETLGMLVDCIDIETPEGIQAYLRAEQPTPEKLHKIVLAALHLGFGGSAIYNAVIKNFGGTIAPLQSTPAIAITPDGHSVRKSQGGAAWDAFAMGRLGCAVGDRMRAKFTIEESTPSYYIMIGFAPHEPNVTHYKPNGFAWYGSVNDGNGMVYINHRGGANFPDDAKHPFARGDVLEIDFDNGAGTAEFFKNGVQVGGGALTALARGKTMYPTIGLHTQGSSVRLELVSFQMPVDANAASRGLLELM